MIGKYSGNREDEGVRNSIYTLYNRLSNRHEILMLNLHDRKNFYRNCWSQIRAFNPQIIHYFHGPTLRSFILSKLLSLFADNTKTILSAMNPRINSYSKYVVPLFKPDIILTQSLKTRRLFEQMGLKTDFLSSGVDLKQFSPVSNDDKEKLRRKYGINSNQFIVLHVGAIRKKRNVEIFSEIQKIKEYQVIIVGSASLSAEKNIIKRLAQSGCIIWKRMFDRIDEIYKLSDCYVFPTKGSRGSIEIPLSVLEAMACNIPVISTRYGALEEIITEGDGFFFAETFDDIKKHLESIYNGIKVNTRKKVLNYSWENIGKDLLSKYESLIIQ